jgi:proline dehydrogenase
MDRNLDQPQALLRGIEDLSVQRARRCGIGGRWRGATMAMRLAGQKLRQGKARGRALAKACVMPLVQRAARQYIAGESLADAQRVVEQLFSRGFQATIGFWDTEQQGAREVADQYLAGLEALAQAGPDSYLSIKLPSLRYSQELLSEVATKAVQVGRRLHFDAMAPDSADRTRAMIDALLTALPDLQVGVTLPGRWKRSLDDAAWVAERGLHVRVVKGEWADPADPDRGGLPGNDRSTGGQWSKDRRCGHA